MIPMMEFKAALDRIQKYVEPTPLRYSEWLSEELNGEVYLKLENFNPGRSFKIRGATNALLSQEKLPIEVITASGGNHGLGVALAATRAKLPCTVVLPTSTSDYRVLLLQKLGAEVLLHGEAWDEANRFAMSLAEDPEKLYIHPFADREVIIGQGTIALEIREQLSRSGGFDRLSNLVASVGGGGLLAGNALALEAMGHQCKVIAVETLGADSLAQSLRAGELVSLDHITSIAKTLGAKTTTPFIFEQMQRLVDEMIVVADRDAVKSLFDILEQEKMLVEPATSCSVAAALAHPELFEKRTSVIIICGSNLSYQEALQWQTQFL